MRGCMSLPKGPGFRPKPENSSSNNRVRRRSGQRRANPKLSLPGEPLIVSREDHPISRKQIDLDALKVMYRLNSNGYRAFLVGGGVRDLYLGKQPKDFDLGTDAQTEAVRSLFRNSRIIGRRFRINHVYFRGNKIIEVSTFRQTNETDSQGKSLLLSSDNTYGDPQTDALRRDLTINGLFYDVSTFSIIDYVGGIDHLKRGIIQMIGDADTRTQEDPVRMIRAIRHAARTGFQIEAKTYDAILKHKQLICLCPGARVYEELLREFKGGSALASFRLLRHTGLLEFLLPGLPEALESEGGRAWSRLQNTLNEIDLSVNQGHEPPTALVFAAIFLGNFPSEYFKVLRGSDRESRLLRDYWEIIPDPSGDDDESGESSQARVVQLRRLINDFFRPIGVSRRDRERIEQALLGRHALLLSHLSGKPSEKLSRKSYFADALELLRYTNHQPEVGSALEYWGAMEPQKPEPSRKKPRRRQRRRR